MKIRKSCGIWGLFVLSVILFSSCHFKSYSGFPVENNLIKLSAEEDLLMPLDLYKSLENTFKIFAESYNYFEGFTEEEFEEFRSFTICIYSLDFCDADRIKNNDCNNDLRKKLLNIIKSERKVKTVIKSLDKISNDNLLKISLFLQTLSDNFDILLYAAGEIIDFDKGNAPWYENREIMFEDFSNDKYIKESIGYIGKYFPKINFVSSYEETGIFKDTI